MELDALLGPVLASAAAVAAAPPAFRLRRAVELAEALAAEDEEAEEASGPPALRVVAWASR